MRNGKIIFSQFSTVSRGVTTKPNIPDNPRNAWTEERDGKYNDKEMENLLKVGTIEGRIFRTYFFN